MVHALEEIHHLLKPDDCSIEIHPVRGTPLVKVYQGSTVLFVGPIPVMITKTTCGRQKMPSHRSFNGVCSPANAAASLIS